LHPPRSPDCDGGRNVNGIAQGSDAQVVDGINLGLGKSVDTGGSWLPLSVFLAGTVLKPEQNMQDIYVQDTQHQLGIGDQLDHAAFGFTFSL